MILKNGEIVIDGVFVLRESVSPGEGNIEALLAVSYVDVQKRK
ncbi:hypothetical protein [Clostridium chromiireducens]|uniref:Uncharacterized protein n=1 Tax=Clostridium chromiireducens TaxID=225345 RepID=A0A1V4IZ99_9CLOT|nr:hypothetical protein [Clostridium chromiireducens]OPJ65382.1 hypothetical protein CLCHR_07720 [Clostridium chromiireducens]